MGKPRYAEAILPVNNLFRTLQSPPLVKLGPLEQRVLSALWQRGDATVRELVNQEKLPRAYTTIMTTVNRLYQKQLLSRVEEGRAFRYTPVHTEAELERKAATESIRRLLSLSPNALLPLSYLVETISEHDVRLLDDLRRLVDEKRRELQKKL